jgi:hypothetical protein
MRKLREFYVGVVPPSGNYANLENLPAINGVVLTPNTTMADLGLTGIYKFKGSVTTKSKLPTKGVSVGDVYDVQDTGSNYAWTGTEWDDLGQLVDLTPYLLKSDATTTYATKEEVSQALSNIDLTKQGNGVPTTSTEGSIGQIYVDITNNEAYICVNTDSDNFTWKKITYTPTSTTVVLSSNNWDTTTRTYTIPVVGLTADTILWIAPTVSVDNANESHFATYGIKALQQNNNSLVINSTVVPSMDISIDIIM